MNIKRLISLFLCAGLMLSCAREIAFDEEDNAPLRDGYRWLELQLSMESSKTNISGSGSTKNIEWTQGDKIDFFWGSGSDEKTTITLKVGGPAANMRVQIPEAVTDVYAAYPSGSATFSEGTLSFEMPGVESGEFSKVNFMASKIVADSENGKKTAVFRSVVSFLKFTVSDPNAQKIEIRARAEENPVLRGTFPVTFDADNNIQIGEVSSTHQTYTMNIGGAGDFYAPILPGKLYADGFELNYYVNNLNTKYYDVDFDFKLDRGFIANFGTVETLFKANAIHEYYVTVSGEGNRDGSSWANAMGKDEFKEKIAGISISKDTDSDEVKAAEDYLKNAIFHIEGGTYDFGALVELGFSNHCKKYINFTFDGGYYNGSKDVQNHPTVFTGGDEHTIFQLARYADLAVMDCTFSHSSGSGGGQAAIRTDSKYTKLTLNGCSFTNNENTATGGALNLGYGTASITNCTFSGNTATVGAAINVNNGGASDIDVTGQITVTGCTFARNTTSSSSDGGAVKIQAGGPVLLSGCTFTGNTNTGGYGAAVFILDAKETLTFTDCTFGVAGNGNTSAKSGGAIRFGEGDATVEFNNCSFTDNTTNSYGGAISIASSFTGTISINGGSISNCSASSQEGGAISQDAGTLVVDGLKIDGCSAKYGGAYTTAGGTAHFKNCEFGKTSRNTAAQRGGCIYSNNVAVTAENHTFTDCWISGQVSSGGDEVTGGGARFGSGASPLFTRCTFDNCSSTTTYSGDGEKSGAGAVHIASSSPSFVSCTFSNCSAEAAHSKAGGGAIRISNSESQPSFDKCKFTNCVTTYRGGAVYTQSARNIDFTECEFTGCYSPEEGACVDIWSTASVTYNFTDCSFHDNTSPWGALYCNNGNSSNRTIVNVTGGDFTKNIGKTLDNSYRNGSALYPSTRATFNVSGVRFEGNVANNGPAVFLGAQTSIFNCEDCEFIDNEAKTNGGVYYANADGNEFYCNNCEFKGNVANNYGGVFYSNNNDTKVYCNSSVFDNNIAYAGAVYGNKNNNFKAYFNACSFKNNNWSKTYSGLTYFGEDTDKPTGNVMGINNCSGRGNYNNGTNRSAQQCTWINLKTDRGLKFIFANNSFIGNLEDANGICSDVSTAPGIIRLDNKNGATSVNLYLANNILMNLSDDKDHDNSHCGIAFSGSTNYPTQYCNFNKGQAKRVQKTEDSGYFGSGNGAGRHKNNFTSLTWNDNSNLWTWNGSGSGGYYLGATATINEAISNADSDFYAWLISVGAVSSNGTSAVDARGNARGLYSLPGSYDTGNKTSPEDNH